MKQAIQDQKILYCDLMWRENIGDPETLCGGPVKPNIVFFGEAMPPRFFEGRDLLRDDKLDLMIVIGTSL